MGCRRVGYVCGRRGGDGVGCGEACEEVVVAMFHAGWWCCLEGGYLFLVAYCGRHCSSVSGYMFTKCLDYIVHVVFFCIGSTFIHKLCCSVSIMKSFGTNYSWSLYLFCFVCVNNL